jgi:putative ABC transport system ATP-binding protein
MEQRKEAFPNQLSGGEQQRAAIARALITRPKVILADEPTGNLDSQNGRRILDLMRNLLTAQGITLLLVTHSMEAAAICDTTWKMQDGNLIT